MPHLLWAEVFRVAEVEPLVDDLVAPLEVRKASIVHVACECEWLQDACGKPRVLGNPMCKRCSIYAVQLLPTQSVHTGAGEPDV